MDWERKFNTIIKDTEANLSRVKHKFNPGSSNNVTWAPKIYSTPMKKSTSLLDIPMSTTPMFLQNWMNQSFHGDLYTPGATTNSFVPYPSTHALQDKIEQQSNAIDHLTGVVHRLETDRRNYAEQIRDLRNEMFTMSEKTSDRRPDPGIERRMETMRREMLGEIQLLQSQLQISSAKGNNSNLSDTQLLSLNRDVLEIKHAFRDELEGFRRDIEMMRSRIAKVELELANLFTGRRDVERRQDGLDRTLNSLSLAQTKSRHLPQSNIAMMNSDKHMDRMQINDLRTTLSALKDKIDILESSSRPQSGLSDVIHSHGIRSPAKKPKLYFNGIPPPSKSKQVDLLDELELSDDDSESSDFTEFEQDVPIETKTSRKNSVGLEKADDLDIDDLDLSDDDLSQNSLAESLDDDDFT